MTQQTALIIIALLCGGTLFIGGMCVGHWLSHWAWMRDTDALLHAWEERAS